MKQFALALIRLYQLTLSPDHGWFKAAYPYGHCRFSPSCSEYARQAVEQKGAAKGLSLAIWRVLRCNPWNRGGIDPVK
ncbi:membrane protein insertion efficiency factor YidD [Patescibacteria group bacterium]|nr:membrane protein insertion efficiency factor YidD [Patescibacteria group bacterium]